MIGSFLRRRHDTACTIELEHSEASLHAHVTLADDTELGPGDRVTVHGDPICLRFGQKIVLHRIATVERAHWIERIWTKAAAQFELSELYEVSFTPGRLP